MGSPLTSGRVKLLLVLMLNVHKLTTLADIVQFPEEMFLQDFRKHWMGFWDLFNPLTPTVASVPCSR